MLLFLRTIRIKTNSSRKLLNSTLTASSSTLPIMVTIYTDLNLSANINLKKTLTDTLENLVAASKNTQRSTKNTQAGFKQKIIFTH